MLFLLKVWEPVVSSICSAACKVHRTASHSYTPRPVAFHHNTLDHTTPHRVTCAIAFP